MSDTTQVSEHVPEKSDLLGTTSTEHRFCARAAQGPAEAATRLSVTPLTLRQNGHYAMRLFTASHGGPIDHHGSTPDYQNVHYGNETINLQRGKASYGAFANGIRLFESQPEPDTVVTPDGKRRKIGVGNVFVLSPGGACRGGIDASQNTETRAAVDYGIRTSISFRFRRLRQETDKELFIWLFLPKMTFVEQTGNEGQVIFKIVNTSKSLDLVARDLIEWRNDENLPPGQLLLFDAMGMLVRDFGHDVSQGDTIELQIHQQARVSHHRPDSIVLGGATTAIGLSDEG